MDGWNTSFLLGRPIFRGELLVLRRVNDTVTSLASQEEKIETASLSLPLMTALFQAVNINRNNWETELPSPREILTKSLKRDLIFCNLESTFHLSKPSIFRWGPWRYLSTSPWVYHLSTILVTHQFQGGPLGGFWRYRGTIGMPPLI